MVESTSNVAGQRAQSDTSSPHLTTASHIQGIRTLLGVNRTRHGGSYQPSTLRVVVDALPLDQLFNATHLTTTQLHATVSDLLLQDNSQFLQVLSNTFTTEQERMAFCLNLGFVAGTPGLTRVLVLRLEHEPRIIQEWLVEQIRIRATQLQRNGDRPPMQRRPQVFGRNMTSRFGQRYHSSTSDSRR